MTATLLLVEEKQTSILSSTDRPLDPFSSLVLLLYFITLEP